VRRSSKAGTAFINLAYVASNEELYLGLLAALSGFGLAPVAAMHDPGSDPQLSRIYRLIEESVISFHDLSYVSLDPPAPRTPRFNMPFELGLAVAVALSANRTHRWFLLEKVPHRAAKSLSDIGGTNVQIHDGRAPSVLKAVSNALARQGDRPTLQRYLHGCCRKGAAHIAGWLDEHFSSGTVQGSPARGYRKRRNPYTRSEALRFATQNPMKFGSG
jgi:hypothetical protein